MCNTMRKGDGVRWHCRKSRAQKTLASFGFDCARVVVGRKNGRSPQHLPRIDTFASNRDRPLKRGWLGETFYGKSKRKKSVVFRLPTSRMCFITWFTWRVVAHFDAFACLGEFPTSGAESVSSSRRKAVETDFVCMRGRRCEVPGIIKSRPMMRAMMRFWTDDDLNVCCVVRCSVHRLSISFREKSVLLPWETNRLNWNWWRCSPLGALDFISITCFEASVRESKIRNTVGVEFSHIGSLMRCFIFLELKWWKRSCSGMCGINSRYLTGGCGPGSWPFGSEDQRICPGGRKIYSIQNGSESMQRSNSAFNLRIYRVENIYFFF